MSGKQWACEAHLPRGGLGFFEKVRLDLATKHYHSCDSTCTCKLPGTGDYGYRYR